MVLVKHAVSLKENTMYQNVRLLKIIIGAQTLWVLSMEPAS